MEPIDSWVAITLTGEVFRPRSSPFTSGIDSKHIVVMGGYDEEIDNYLKDVYVIDINEGKVRKALEDCGTLHCSFSTPV